MWCNSTTDSTVWMGEDERQGRNSQTVTFKFYLRKFPYTIIKVLLIGIRYSSASLPASLILIKLEESVMTHTRKMAIIAILSAISFLLMFFDFPLLPGASFLKLDFSILPILIGLVVLDLKGAFSILLLRSILKLVLNNQGVNTYIGLPMNIIAVAIFVIAFGLIWKKEQTTVRFLNASVLGTLGLTLAMLILNYIYAIPLYATFANFDISKILGVANYLFVMVIPFNLLEGTVFAIAFWLSNLLLKPILIKYEK